jgi:hypothetical protein
VSPAKRNLRKTHLVKKKPQQDPDMLPGYDFSNGVRGKYAASADNSQVRRAAPPVAIRRVPGQRPLPALSKAEVQALLEDEEVQAAPKAGAPGRSDRS